MVKTKRTRLKKRKKQKATTDEEGGGKKKWGGGGEIGGWRREGFEEVGKGKESKYGRE